LKKIWAVALKEVRQTVRDPLTLGMLLGVPAMMLLLYGYALNFDVRHVRLAVQDRSHSAASRDLVASFVNSTYFDLAASLPDDRGAADLLERREARAVLVIPEDYARKIASGRTAEIQILLDGSDAGTATTVLTYASSLVAEANVDLAARTLASSRGPGTEGGVRREAGGRGGAAPVFYEPRVWYNPELRSTQFLIPGLMGFILVVTAVLSTALSVVREKERGTMEQIRVTSLRPLELILGKTLPYLVISLAATVTILAAARALFGVAVRGPYLDLFAATLLYLAGALGFGVLVSTISDSQAMAFQVGSITTMLPAIFLSGFIFPIRSMPPLLQAITYAFPARYYLIILRGVILKGAGLAPYHRELLFLGLYTLAVLGIAYARLARKED